MTRLFLLLLLLLLLAVTTSGAAAQTDSLPPFDALLNRAREFVKQGDYASCVKCYEEAEKVFAELPDSLRTQFSDDGELFGGFYYNKACYLSMAGRRKAAVETFEHYADRVIGREEVDFPWICQDSDLDNIRSDKRFRRVLERLSQYGDYKSVLCSAAPYRADSVDTMPRFRYAAPNDRNLVRLRRKFDLDSIAGAGDEISKILNLMTWVHDAVRHDGGSDNPSERNAEAMIELCRREGRGVNCRMLAQILNECYLAMGFKSRFVTCMPRKLFNDCHVINAVYSATLDKWVWVDPTFNAYVMDENGTLLSIAEVRERLRDGRPLVLNEDANWNRKEAETKEHYLDYYMAKNLYYVVCSEWSMYNTETRCEGRPRMSYVALVPEGFRPDESAVQLTSDDRRFWQSPYEETN